MKRKGEHVKGKGLVAALLAGSMLLAGSLAYFSPGRVWAKETGEAAVDTETAETETEALVCQLPDGMTLN